jgi:alkanesulfonate monooxygenase SsuD/methylene tetrahydromethanopterin reductase-like flavin-dependent oxidoreductase (luciferase family)
VDRDRNSSIPEIALGLDARLGLSTAQLRDLAPLAKELGYRALWTNASVDYDPIDMCVSWNAVSGLPTGVSVVPIARNPPAVLALAARTAHELSDGRFVLGIGSGSVAEKPIRAVREYVEEIRKTAPQVQLAIGALGPQMLRLASTHAQAVALNWCTPEQVAWSRAQTGPATRLVEYIRVSVDDDVALARFTLAKQIFGYAVVAGSSGARGYPAHFERMGFGQELDDLRRRRAEGASDDELAREMPEHLVSAFGYYGAGADGPQKLAGLALGLDVAIVRVLNTRPGDPSPVRRAIEVFAPSARRTTRPGR